jgi:pyruvate dehydrogenase E1 component alpha subunit
VQAAYDFADQSPDPAVESVYDDIFAPEDQIDEMPHRRPTDH